MRSQDDDIMAFMLFIMLAVGAALICFFTGGLG